MSAVGTLWRFSRPHTVVGSLISICTLYAMVCARAVEPRPALLAGALLIGVCCNIFIVGLNQLADVEVDRVNKPHLPLPAGELSRPQAWSIVLACLSLGLGLAFTVSPWLFAVVGTASLIGWAYSMPPLHLKRHHVSAALAITTVRGLLVNLGGFLVYDHLVNGDVHVPPDLWMLTGFILAFGIAIAWFKDLPDMAGDACAGLGTLPLRTSPRTTLIVGHVLVATAYLLTIIALFIRLPYQPTGTHRVELLLWGHGALLLLFLWNALGLRSDKPDTHKRFYIRFWWFFFAEYGLYLVAYLL